MIFEIDGKQFEIGLFDAQAAMEACEREAGLQPQSTAPTVDLLEIVAAWVERRHSVKLTLTAAWQLWWGICETLDRARKSHQRVADVGAWLHIDATQMAEQQLFGLLANIPRIQSQLRLHAGQFDALDYEGVYQLVLAATGDERQAREARIKALERYVDSCCGGK
jgi:hypothetical protein